MADTDYVAEMRRGSAERRAALIAALRATPALTQREVAALLGWMPDTLRRRRIFLEASGFPARFPGQHRGRIYSSRLVFDWLDRGGLDVSMQLVAADTENGEDRARRAKAAERLAAEKLAGTSAA